MKLKYLCVFDMDGTLLNTDHLIPERNKEAISELKKRGVGVVLATGRTELMTRKYVQELELDLPIITNNGSLVVDTMDQKILYRNTFSAQTLRTILNYVVSGRKDYFIYTIDKVFYPPNGKRIQIMNLYNSMVPESEKIETVILPEDVDQIMALLPDLGEQCAFKVLISEQNEEDYEFCKTLTDAEAIASQPISLDIMPLGSTKGNALQFVVNYLNVDPKNVFAFGDNYNDISMLTYAGHAIVPENGVDEARAAADFIAFSNDDAGVGEGIFDYVLPRIHKD